MNIIKIAWIVNSYKEIKEIVRGLGLKGNEWGYLENHSKYPHIICCEFKDNKFVYQHGSASPEHRNSFNGFTFCDINNNLIFETLKIQKEIYEK